jgi:hypothetical protein
VQVQVAVGLAAAAVARGVGDAGRRGDALPAAAWQRGRAGPGLGGGVACLLQRCGAES